MLTGFIDRTKRFYFRQYATLALARGSATAVTRELDPVDPLTWEFSAFSQNGEDGIIDYLSRKVDRANRYFVEIGASKGMENNTSWLAVGRKYNGLWVEGNSSNSKTAEKMIAPLNLGVECLNMQVTPDNVSDVKEKALHADPDVFSLDIDGMDYYVMKALFEQGFRPKICVVEYNSAFGPEMKSTIAFRDNFDYEEAHSSKLYFGVSISGWKTFFERNEYDFVTVDSNGVNALFVAREAFDPEFVSGLKGLDYRENYYQTRKFKSSWMEQYKYISDMEFMDIE